ncbi:DUF2572 family protein [Pasteurellaceae bacterium USgator11]|nr:DUF2572 family protein [Pasteurellaceae bacterium USgator41]TNG93933.1 DUF2572 family protein [Pasteurellaceae bacterium UScroc12]TNG97919.1 DUF2572 family protein [Pasteurellaceae bacterium UScroc31]TNH02037.1 DUF2572 family protein [Pasteurellaceae bacterium USgator11]
MLKKGVVTLTALLLLSSALLLFLMLDEQILALHRADLGERLRYLQQRERLLQQSVVADGNTLCRQQSVVQTENFFSIHFTDSQQDQQHRIICHRLTLFKTLPQQASAKGWSNFLHPDWQTGWQQSDFVHLPLNAADYAANRVLWIEGDSEWQLAQDFYGVVLVNGRLKLSGEGKIIGALIYQTALQSTENQIEFNQSVVNNVAEQYQQWLYRSDSWHDFNPL